MGNINYSHARRKRHVCSGGVNVNTQFHDTFSTSPIQPSPTSLWVQFMYYIIFIILSMAQAYVTYWGKLKKYGLEGMDQFLSDFFA